MYTASVIGITVIIAIIVRLNKRRQPPANGGQQQSRVGGAQQAQPAQAQQSAAVGRFPSQQRRSNNIGFNVRNRGFSL